MPAQGTHIALAYTVARSLGLSVSNELIAGTLVVDSIKDYTGKEREASHFYNRKYAILPELEKLPMLSEEIEVGTFEEDVAEMLYYTEVTRFEKVSTHLKESPYKMGIRIHLVLDAVWNKYLRDKVIDNSKLKTSADRIIIERSTGLEMPWEVYLNRLYTAYTVMDSYCLKKAGITPQKISDIKAYLCENMNAKMSSWLCGYIKISEEFEENDFLKFAQIDEAMEKANKVICDYVKKFM